MSGKRLTDDREMRLAGPRRRRRIIIAAEKTLVAIKVAQVLSDSTESKEVHNKQSIYIIL